MSENKKAVPGRDGKRATTDSTLNIAQNNITIFSPYNQAGNNNREDNG